MLQEEDKFVCNVTVFQVELSEVERVRAGPDRTGPGSILVARGLLLVRSGGFYWGARGLLLVWSGVFYFMGMT